MSLTHPKSFWSGMALLSLVWSDAVSFLGWWPFSAHMAMHMVVVAVAAPLLALGVAGGRFDPVQRRPALFSAVLASMVEFVVVWVWHTPHLHHAAREHTVFFVAEQASFFSTGMYLWLSAWGGDAPLRMRRGVGGMVGLLLTSMHMTLLGALIALSKRPLYLHPGGSHHDVAAHDVAFRDTAFSSVGVPPLDPLLDQQIGGAIMLFLGASSYLAGGVLLARHTFALPLRAAKEGAS